MLINNIGFNHTHDADFNVRRPIGSGDYLLLLLKTPAIFTLDGNDVFSKENSFIIYSIGEPQYYRVNGNTFSNDWLHFSADNLEINWIQSLGISFNTVYSIGDLHELSMLIASLSYENYSSIEKDIELIDLTIRILFKKISRKLKNPQENRTSNHFSKLSVIRTKIYNQPEINWNIDNLSHELTMSRSTFQHLYKKYFGISPTEDVISSRLERAKYLLSTTDTSIQGISEFCGYHSDIHFMRQFKKHLLMTPSDFRKKKCLD